MANYLNMPTSQQQVIVMDLGNDRHNGLVADLLRGSRQLVMDLPWGNWL